MKNEITDESIKELVGIMHTMETEKLPKNEELEGKYQLSDSFYKNMDRMITRHNRKKAARKVMISVASAAAACLLLVCITCSEYIVKAMNSIWTRGTMESTETQPENSETPENPKTPDHPPKDTYAVTVEVDPTDDIEAGGTVKLTAKVTKNGVQVTNLSDAGLALWWKIDTWGEDHKDGLTEENITFSNYDNNSGDSLTADATLKTAGKYYVMAQLKKGNTSLVKKCVTLTAVPPASTIEGDINVEKVVGLRDDFIMGMDISSVISEFKSGVTFKDYKGKPIDNVTDFCRFLAENKVTTIRVRVWNDPFDADGNGYGGGNNDMEVAKEIADACRKANLKMLVDFHCSDFWADPGKQQAPKAWANDTLEQKEEALSRFISESLQTIDPKKDTVTMVQVGNEITGGFVGEKSDTSEGIVNMCKLFEAGAQGVHTYNEDVKVVIHVTDPEKGNMTKWAGHLSKNSVPYDVLATSYYPYWHGSLANLGSEMESVRETYQKEVMVAETSYAYTLDDFDGHGNTVCVGSNDEGLDYPFTEQGQANAIRDVIDTVNKAGGIGVFYWEPAWITVGDVSGLAGTAYDDQVKENRRLWEEHGSGWASSYSAEYDPEDAGKWYGGSAMDNQAMFYSDGAPIASLHVWEYVKTGATSRRVSVKGIQKVGETIENGAALPELPTTVRVTYNKGKRNDPVEWNTQGVDISGNKVNMSDIDTKIPNTYVFDGVITLSMAVNIGDYAGKKTAPIKYTLTVKGKDYLVDSGFEEDGSGWTFTGSGAKVNGEDHRSGKKGLHFYADEAFEFTASQKVTLAAGKYRLGAYIQGLHMSDNDVFEISVAMGDKTVTKEVKTLDGWKNWINLETDEIVVTADNTEVTVTIHVSAAAGSWGTWDDVTLIRTGNYTETLGTVEIPEPPEPLGTVEMPDHRKLEEQYV